VSAAGYVAKTAVHTQNRPLHSVCTTAITSTEKKKKWGHLSRIYTSYPLGHRSFSSPAFQRAGIIYRDYETPIFCSSKRNENQKRIVK